MESTTRTVYLLGIAYASLLFFQGAREVIHPIRASELGYLHTYLG